MVFQAETLQQKFAQAKAGDFIVTAQESNYSALFYPLHNADTLLLEEIWIPDHQIDLKKIQWQDWVAKKSGAHLVDSLEIDRRDGTLIECFSYSKNGCALLG